MSNRQGLGLIRDGRFERMEDVSTANRAFRMQQLTSSEQIPGDTHAGLIDDQSDSMSVELGMEIIDTTRMCATGAAPIWKIVKLLFVCDVAYQTFSYNEKKAIYDFAMAFLMSLNYGEAAFQVFQELQYIPQLIREYEEEFYADLEHSHGE